MTQLPTRSRPIASVYCGLAAAFTLLLAGSAAAQDSPEPPSFDWSGFYVGVTAGGGGYKLTVTDVGDENGSWFGTPGASGSEQVSGFLGGVRAGYNHAFDQVVVGIEADVSATGFSLYGTSEEARSDIVVTSDIPWLATVRGRVGLAVPDTPLPALIYGTGGLAVAQIKHTIGDTSPVLDAGQFGPNSVDETRAGFAVGAGVEMAVTDNVLVGLEYLYMDFGKTSVNGICVVCFGGGTPGTPYIWDFEDRVQTIRLNLSWKFGG